MFRIRFIHALGLFLLGIITISIFSIAQTPTATGPVQRFTATTVNVSGAPDPIRIDVLAWSTDADRDQLVGAWNLTAAPPAAAGGAGAGRGAAGGRGGGGGRGAAGGGRGGAAPEAGAAGGNAAPEAPAGGAAGAPAGGGRGARGGGAPAAGGDAGAAAANPAQAAGAVAGGAAAGGGGGRGGGGGGRGRGGAAGPPADAVRQTPETALAAALQAAKTVGYLWSSESAGYSLRYAYRMKQPDGSERIIFATDRRLGAWNNLWKAAGNATPSNYEFSIIEVRIPAKGDGEAKASLVGKVAIDSTVNSIALADYATQPVILKEVRRK
jgi:hypothetical protein